ncbi:MAG TPA: hypothetical protein VLA88_01560 [Candidatus Saccharimonadales bacterium]|nr:hypothetical protein [Candidatus Saccharimonadales bacterium]
MRQTTGVGGWLMRRMPPTTHGDFDIPPVIEPTLRQWRKAVLTHLVWFLPAVTAVLLLVPEAYSRTLQMMSGFSVLGTVPTVVSLTTHNNLPLTIYTYVAMAVMAYGVLWIVRHPKQYGQGVGDEERWCREGAEFWSIGQRIKACVIFGLMHVRLLVVPFVVGVTTGLLGAVLMHEYLRAYRENGQSRKAALQASRTLHMAANTVGMRLFVVFFMISFTLITVKTLI